MVSRQPPTAGPDALARMSWHTFEHLLAEHYRAQGWRVEYDSRPKSLKALGTCLDLRMRRGDEVTIVQCRQWDAAEVAVDDVNDLLATMLNEAVSGGILVTRGTFSAEARAAQRRQPRLQLVDGDVLRVMLKLSGNATDMGGNALPDTATRAPRTSRTAAHADRSAYTAPAIVAAVVIILLGVFVWRAMATRTPPPAPVAEGAPAPSPAPTPMAAPTVPAVAPASTALPPPSHRTQEPSDSLARELAERERLRDARSGARQDAHRPAEDAMKVMERNTRELGSAE